MSLRCLVIVGLVLAAESATIKNRRNIPVEIVYDKNNPAIYGNKNLDAKLQLSSDELLRLKLSTDIINEDKLPNEEESIPMKNLNEKVQLSQEEIVQASKAPPSSEVLVKSAEEEKPTTEEHSLMNLIKKAEDAAYNGINSIKANIDQATDIISKAKPTFETWDKLNQTIDGFFKEQYKRANLKDDNDNNNQNGGQFFQNLVNNFQTTVTNFISNYTQQNNEQKPGEGKPEDEQTNEPNPWQNVVNFFSNGLNQITNNINNLNSQNATSGQEDTGTSNGATNFFGNAVNTFTQFFGGQGNSQGQNPNNQSDTGTQPPSNGVGFIQGAVQQVINNFIPSSSTSKPVQGDEGTSTTPSSIISGFNPIQVIGQVVGGQGGANPIASGAQAIGGQLANGSNPFTSGAQAIGSQIGQLAQGQGGSNPITSGAQAVGSQIEQLAQSQGGSNPIASGAQAVGSQIGQLAQGQGGSNPISSGAQAVGSQIEQLAQSQGGSNPISSGAQAVGSQIEQLAQGQGGSNPIVSGAQAVGNQIGQLAQGGSGKISEEEPSKETPVPLEIMIMEEAKKEEVKKKIEEPVKPAEIKKEEPVKKNE